jgi:hypothetical protein
MEKQVLGKIVWLISPPWSLLKRVWADLIVFGQPSRMYPLFKQSDLFNRYLKTRIRNYYGNLGTILSGLNY